MLRRFQHSGLRLSCAFCVWICAYLAVQPAYTPSLYILRSSRVVYTTSPPFFDRIPLDVKPPILPSFCCFCSYSMRLMSDAFMYTAIMFTGFLSRIPLCKIYAPPAMKCRFCYRYFNSGMDRPIPISSNFVACLSTYVLFCEVWI